MRRRRTGIVYAGEKRGRLDERKGQREKRDRERESEKSDGGGWRVSSGEPVLGAWMVAESPERAVCSSFHKPPVCISLHT